MRSIVRAALAFLLLCGASRAALSQTVIDTTSIESRLRAGSEQPYRLALSKTGCSPLLSAGYDASWVAKLRSAAIPIRNQIVGTIPAQFAGENINSFPYLANADYRFSLAVIQSRLLGVRTFAYVLEPRLPAGPKPTVILLHGSGTLPTQGFSLRLNDEGGSVTRVDSTPFIGIGLSLAQAGFTVIAPILGRTPVLGVGQTPWMFTSVYGEVLREKSGRGGVETFLASGVEAAMDFATAKGLAQRNGFYLVGWNEGAYMASLIGSLDSRVRAIVRLEAPFDRKGYRNGDGMQRDASFAHVECMLGDVAQAALMDGKPLMYASASDDANEILRRGYRSRAVEDSLRAVYAETTQPQNLNLQLSAQKTDSVHALVTRWLGAIANIRPPGGPPLPPPAVDVRLKFPLDEFDQITNETGGYLGRLQSCKAVTLAVLAAPDNPAAVSGMIQSALGAQAPLGMAKALSRQLIDTSRGYRLSLIVYGRPGGSRWHALLAEPLGEGTHPGMVSFNGIDRLGDLFGIGPPEGTPYLNAYADQYARRGFVIVVPIVPNWVPTTFAALSSARSIGRSSLWGLLLDSYEGSIDVLLSLPMVDSSRVVAYGISFGGLAASLTASVDVRLKAVVYSDPVEDYQTLFDRAAGAYQQTWLADACSVADATLLAIAPRRLIWEAGEDPFGLNENMEVVARVRERYRRLGVEDQFSFFRHSGGHTTYPENISIFGR